MIRPKRLSAPDLIRGLTLTASFTPGRALAHASDQSFVLLLPTGAYITAGVTAVILTVVALFLIPERLIRGLFKHKPLITSRTSNLPTFTSLASFTLLAALVALGIAGPRDPLSNLMPLVFWTLGWVGIVSLSGVFGNLWHWLNP